MGDPAFCERLAVSMSERSFSERFRSKNAPEDTAKAATHSKARIDRSASWYVKFHLTPFDRLEGLHDPVAFTLFGILLRISFDERGKPFELPVQRLMLMPGLRDLKRIRVKLRQLERHGLISVTAQPSKPLMIRVPLAL
jgi:hypothetical protein